MNKKMAKKWHKMAKNPAKMVLNPLHLYYIPTKSPVLATLPVFALGLPNMLLALSLALSLHVFKVPLKRYVTAKC